MARLGPEAGGEVTILRRVRGWLHWRLIFRRRIRVLAQAILPLLPEKGCVLDVGCGSGELAAILSSWRPGLVFQGLDVLARDTCAIPVTPYDGTTFPFPDSSFDVVLFVDVLHHTHEPFSLLCEARRVARANVIVKDHLCDGPLARLVLKFMDWVGNAPHGVAMPFHFLSREEWERGWRGAGLEAEVVTGRIGLYPVWARPIFEWNLHFLARFPVGR